VPNVTAKPAPSAAGSTTRKRKKAGVQTVAKQTAPGVEMVAVPVELLEEVRALITGRRNAEPGATPDGGT
jgi:hypothetical protein